MNCIGWKILIHDRLDSPLIDLRTHGTTLYRGWAKDIRIYTREVWLRVKQLFRNPKFLTHFASAMLLPLCTP